MRIDIARHLASDIMRSLRPYCSQIDIAGSIRRSKNEVKDIEIVCIPKKIPASSDELFGKLTQWKRDSGFIKAVNKWDFIKGNASDGKYMQRQLTMEPEDYPAVEERKVTIDIFTALPETYGSILLIRTGDVDFSKLFMGTLLPRKGFKAEDGFIWQNGNVVKLPTEQDVFSLVGVPFIEPHLRDVKVLQKYL